MLSLQARYQRELQRLEQENRELRQQNMLLRQGRQPPTKKMKVSVLDNLKNPQYIQYRRFDLQNYITKSAAELVNAINLL